MNENFYTFMTMIGIAETFINVALLGISIAALVGSMISLVHASQRSKNKVIPILSIVFGSLGILGALLPILYVFGIIGYILMFVSINQDSQKRKIGLYVLFPIIGATIIALIIALAFSFSVNTTNNLIDDALGLASSKSEYLPQTSGLWLTNETTNITDSTPEWLTNGAQNIMSDNTDYSTDNAYDGLTPLTQNQCIKAYDALCFWAADHPTFLQSIGYLGACGTGDYKYDVAHNMYAYQLIIYNRTGQAYKISFASYNDPESSSIKIEGDYIRINSAFN